MINMINISPVLSTFSSKCAGNKGNVNNVDPFPLLVCCERLQYLNLSVEVIESD